jgi:hypothetical protein
LPESETGLRRRKDGFSGSRGVDDINASARPIQLRSARESALVNSSDKAERPAMAAHLSTPRGTPDDYRHAVEPTVPKNRSSKTVIPTNTTQVNSPQTTFTTASCAAGVATWFDIESRSPRRRRTRGPVVVGGNCSRHRGRRTKCGRGAVPEPPRAVSGRERLACLRQCPPLFSICPKQADFESSRGFRE